MATRLSGDDTQFVIFGGRARDGGFAYANVAGGWGVFSDAGLWSGDAVMAAARALAGALQASLYVAPLLFGVPEVESTVLVGPDAQDD